MKNCPFSACSTHPLDSINSTDYRSEFCVVSDLTPRMVDDNFSDISGVIAVHDDIIIAGKDTAEHDSALKQLLESARSRKIKFNRSKVQHRVNQVKYLGDIVTADRFKPDPKKTKTIINMPEPQNK